MRFGTVTRNAVVGFPHPQKSKQVVIDPND